MSTPPAPDAAEPIGKQVQPEQPLAQGSWEAALAEIWTQVLGVERVGVEDNFFELGGDSILSIQVIAKAAKIGIRIDPRQLFEHPTIAELAPLAGEVSHLSVARDEELAASELPDLIGPTIERIGANLARLHESLSRIEAKLEGVAG
jgi:aryl carrier-like protein